MAEQDLKIQWEIHFFTFLNTDCKAPKKIQNSNYIGLLKKSAFKNDFGPREVLKLKMLTRRRLNIFSSSPSRGKKNIFESRFLKKSSINQSIIYFEMVQFSWSGYQIFYHIAHLRLAIATGCLPGQPWFVVTYIGKKSCTLGYSIMLRQGGIKSYLEI